MGDFKNKIVLINLWATWSGPSLHEIPQLVKLTRKYRDSGLEVIGLNVGDGSGHDEKASVEAFATKMRMNYLLASIPDQLSKDIMVLTKFPGVPQSVLIDRRDRLRGVFVGAGKSTTQQMKALVYELIAESNP